MFVKIVRDLTWKYYLGPKRVKNIRKFNPPFKLHLGCGQNYFDGWINIDISKGADPDVYVDLRSDPLPIKQDSCSHIYSEHLLEHLPRKEGLRLLKEAHRVLSKGGTLRVAMPSLKYVIQKYLSKGWREQDWLKNPSYEDVQTPAHMLNLCFRSWGHEWLYDEEELESLLLKAGFTKFKRFQFRESDDVVLKDLESRQDSLLIIEAYK